MKTYFFATGWRSVAEVTFVAVALGGARLAEEVVAACDVPRDVWSSSWLKNIISFIKTWVFLLWTLAIKTCFFALKTSLVMF